MGFLNKAPFQTNSAIPKISKSTALSAPLEMKIAHQSLLAAPALVQKKQQVLHIMYISVIKNIYIYVSYTIRNTH